MTEVEQHLIENVDGNVYYNCAYQFYTFNEGYSMKNYTEV